MSKISCNVTRDLFAVYLDEICSEESRELVEEHLRECPECKQLMQSIQTKETKKATDKEQIRFFEKAKKYLDNRYRLVFIIALIFAALMGIYSDFYFSCIPDVLVLVSVPVLMCTFFLAQPVERCREKKYYLLQWSAILTVVLLVGLQVFIIWQLTILLDSPGDARLLAIFKWEPYQIGPFLENVYWCFILLQEAFIVLYYLLGKRKNCSFIIGQNVSWLGIGLGLIFRNALYGMDTMEGYRQNNIEYGGILLAEFVVAILLNYIYVKKRKRDLSTSSEIEI